MKKQLIIAVTMAVLSAGAANVFAKTINLYSEPKADSKIAGTVNTETGVTIIFTPKTGDWMKVANPTNGDVGWVKSSDLGGNHYNMRVITSGDGTRSYSVYQFGGNTVQYSQEQIDKEMQQFERQQRMMQIHMNHMMNDLFYFPQPMFVPVVMVPVPAHEKKAPKNTITPKPQSQASQPQTSQPAATQPAVNTKQ